jgi:predicted RND superfamily exporter protein
MSAGQSRNQQQVIGAVADFDERSGSRLERALFNHRSVVLVFCALITLVLGFIATRVRMNANFENTIPTEHPFVRNMLAHQDDLRGLGNAVRIAVETTSGSIYDPAYLKTLQQINDAVLLLPGVDRMAMKSLWTPNVRWVGVTEDGLEGGPVIPETYDGSPAALAQVRANVARSGEIGQLVAADATSSVIFVPLLANDASTGAPLDYAAFATRLDGLRLTFERAPIAIHVTGFAQIVGDLIGGLHVMLLYFAASVAIAALILFWYTRCIRSTLLVVACSLVAVIWQLGLVVSFGFALDPYSILVPFLIFAIGMSHGAQKMNGIMQDIGRGTHRWIAARYTFRRLFVAGLTALVCDAVGFAILLLVDIRVIRDLALIASAGVAILIFTNLILLPVLLSYVGVSPAAARRSLRTERADVLGTAKHPLWRALDLFTRRRWATVAVCAAAVLAVGGAFEASHLRIGDLDRGAPELRPDSRYNRDDAFMTRHYGASSDVFAVMLQTPDGDCADYTTMSAADALEWQLRQVPGVDSTSSVQLLARQEQVLLTEGSPAWYELVANQRMLNHVVGFAPHDFVNADCNLQLLYVYLKDHRADTLGAVVDAVTAFAQANDSPQRQFQLAAGSAGIAAATNQVLAKDDHEMLAFVYLAVIAMCMLAFRSWRAVLCAVLPLLLTSILAEALMVLLHIGVKVATLPVIALGVGIGVDYSLYVMSMLLARLREGMSLGDAYYAALLFTGRVVLLTGVTLAIGVGTWFFSPIKFQADMGVLLAFMFVVNMIGAVVLLPALAYFLLRPAPPEAPPALPIHALEPAEEHALTAAPRH